jgi:hypothetical protein
LFKNDDIFYDFLKGSALRVKRHNLAGHLARPGPRRRHTQHVDEEEVRRVVGFGVLQHRKQKTKKFSIPAPDLKNEKAIFI